MADQSKAADIAERAFGKTMEDISIDILRAVQALVYKDKDEVGKDVKAKFASDEDEESLSVAEAIYNTAMIRALFALGCRLYYDQFGKRESSDQEFLNIVLLMYQSINGIKCEGKIVTLPISAAQALGLTNSSSMKN
jgi:hypothetical protein